MADNSGELRFVMRGQCNSTTVARLALSVFEMVDWDASREFGLSLGPHMVAKRWHESCVVSKEKDVVVSKEKDLVFVHVHDSLLAAKETKLPRPVLNGLLGCVWFTLNHSRVVYKVDAT